jgi:flagellar basal body-associated protein FliL
MADADDVKEEEKQEDSKAENTGEKPSSGRSLPWVIMAVVVVASAGAGFGLGRLFAGSRTSETAELAPQDDLVLAGGSAKNSKKTWYYDLEPVVANLDVPGVTRYVRATLTLEISRELEQKKGNALLVEKKPILTNWLTIYLASLSLGDIRGDKNLRRIQSQITDAFNEILFPDAKPQIENVLFKEFPIQ